MSDERHDDEILGRALSRAIETQQMNETPYERSRLATRPARRGFPVWQALGAAAVLVLAVAFGAWFTRPRETPSAAASSTPTPTASSEPATPVQTASPEIAPAVDTRVFFVRDLLPPVSAIVPAHGPTFGRPEARILTRIGAAHEAAQREVPAGATNPLSLLGTSPGASSSSYVVSARVDRDTVTIEFDLPNGWNVHGSAQAHALVQQIVYVATEEPGIHRVRITEKGKPNAVIDGLVIDRALSREDVTAYNTLGSTKPALGYGDTSKAAARKLTLRTSVDTLAPGMARIEIVTDLTNVSPTVMYPDFKVEVFENDEATSSVGGKWRMVVTVNGDDPAVGSGRVIDLSPLRNIVTTTPTCAGCSGTVYEIGLDDLRPWRTAVEFDPFRIIIDIGGDPRTIFANNAVYAPSYDGTVARTFTVAGIEHNFEANVVIRVKDEREKVLLQTFTTGTNCCDPGGTFEKTIDLPSNVTGRIYLEVYAASAKDGSDLALIRIPLTVR